MIDELKKTGLIVGAGSSESSSSGRVAVEAPDTLESIAYIDILDLIGEGQIGGLVDGAKSIFLDGTPVLNADGTPNFTGFSWAMRNGTQDQDPIDGFDTIETPAEINVRVKTDTPRVFTITNPNVNRVRVIVTFPALITVDAATGDTNGASAQYQFSISTDGGEFVEVGTFTISGKTRSTYQRAHTLTLPKPGSSWSIKMTRLTEDSESQNLNNNTYLYAYVEVIDRRLSYPNSALVGVSIDSRQFQSVPKRAYLVDGLLIQVPSNYDPESRTYTGIWNGTFKLAVSNNPAWVLYDLLTHTRYGLGKYLSASQIDKAMLYKIGRYCDEMVDDGFGGYEPRFTINTVIQQQAEAYKIISDICSVFRGMAYWNGSMVSVTSDMPGEPSMTFSPANVVGGEFNYSGSSRKDRHSVVLVTWNDPDQQYEQKIEYVEDADLIAKVGVRKVDMVAFGCTSRGQANRAGRWILYTEKFESDMISFTVGLDSAFVLPGELVNIHDTYRAGKRMGGRIKSGTATSVELDSPVELTQPNARLSIRLQDGTFAERYVNEGVGTHASLSWSDALAEAPLPNAIWLVSEATLEPMIARVVGVAQGDTPGQFQITCVEHNPDKFDAIEKGLVLEERNTSIIDPNNVTTPAELRVTEEPYQGAPGIVGTTLHVSWSGNAKAYELSWRRIGKYQTNWQTISTSSSSIDLENVRKGVHEFSLVAISQLGNAKSSAVTLSHDVIGRTTAPGDVNNFRITRRTTDLMLQWDAVTDIAIAGYELRIGSGWDEGEVLTTNFKGTQFIHDQEKAGVYTYHIRAIDLNGNYSDNVSHCVLTLDPPAAVSNFIAVQSNSRLEFRWDKSTDIGVVGYEIREGDTWGASTLITQLSATTYTIPAGAAGDRTFWIKAIASPGIYSNEATMFMTAVAQLPNVNQILTHSEAPYTNGYRWNLQVNGDELVMTGTTSRGEYVFTVDLGSEYRAQNTLFYSLRSITYDATTWRDINYAWRDPDAASRSWAKPGAIDAITAKFQIATRLYALKSGQVDMWSFSGGLTSFALGNPSVSRNITYDQGRFMQGVYVKDLTELKYSVTYPLYFNVSFWLVIKDLISGIYWQVNGAGGIFMRVYYDTARQMFVLEDNLTRQVTVPFAIAAEDRIVVAVSQGASSRTLFVGRVGESAVYATQAFEPQGVYTQLCVA